MFRVCQNFVQCSLSCLWFSLDPDMCFVWACLTIKKNCITLIAISIVLELVLGLGLGLGLGSGLGLGLGLGP